MKLLIATAAGLLFLAMAAHDAIRLLDELDRQQDERFGGENEP